MEQSNSTPLSIETLKEEFEIRDRGIKREFRNVHDIMTSRFLAIDQRFSAMDRRLDEHTCLLRNSKIVHLGQKILPLAAYEHSNKPLPIPKSFPSTALKLYRLQDRKNRRKLTDLLSYYGLCRETIRLVRSFSTSSHSDADSDSDSESDEKTFLSAVDSNPRGAVFILGSHLGVDCDALEDRVREFEYRTYRTTTGKRPAEGGTSERRTISKLDRDFVPVYPQGRFSDSEKSEDKRTDLHWEVNSAEFRKTTAHLQIRDRLPESCSRKSQDDGTQLESPTEKISSPSVK